MPDFRFRLPPVDELTIPQKLALDEPRSLLVTGGPGSGKTVVSIFRYLKQIGNKKNVIFFTFNRTLMSSIKGTLRQRANVLLPDLTQQQIEDLLQRRIGSIHEWYWSNFSVAMQNEEGDSIGKNFTSFVQNRGGQYNELFIDESQDLRPVIIDKTHLLAEKISCGADRSQDLQGHYVRPADDMIFEILSGYNDTKRQELTLNFRNTREIFSFARNFVPEDENVQTLDLKTLAGGERPDIRGSIDELEQLALIKEIITQNPNSNIGILVHTGPQINMIRTYLDENGYSLNNEEENFTYSYYHSKMSIDDRSIVENRLQTPFILTFESCKGLEFDIVILPFFEKCDWALNNYKPNNTDPDLDANGNPKTWATPNHYYVASTRARRQLFILYNDKPDILDFYNEENQKDLFKADDLPY